GEVLALRDRRRTVGVGFAGSRAVLSLPDDDRLPVVAGRRIGGRRPRCVRPRGRGPTVFFNPIERRAVPNDADLSAWTRAIASALSRAETHRRAVYRDASAKERGVAAIRVARAPRRARTERAGTDSRFAHRVRKQGSG